MSQRIADSLEVLDLIRGLAKQNPSKAASSWRQEAIAHVASRGVKTKTVYAHLVGKNTHDKRRAYDIDHLIETWINKGSTDLRSWILNSCENQDRKRVEQFFDSPQSTPIAADINDPEETESHLVTTYRVLRDTALARRIKADNDHKCQICGTRLLIGKDTAYAEAHHVKPLGRPHDGPDHPGNIVCVCPNCHVELDYGAIEIDQKIFKNVLPEFIEYHNEVIRKKAV